MNDEIEIRCSPDREAAGLLFFGGRISVWLGCVSDGLMNLLLVRFPGSICHQSWIVLMDR